MSELKDVFLQIIKSQSQTPDAELLATSMDEYVSSAIAKFIKGFEEHKGSIIDRAMIQEIESELIDLDHYVAALKSKHNTLIQKAQIVYLSHPTPETKELVTLLTNL